VRAPAALRVPAAWGTGGEAMVEAASLALPFTTAAVVSEPTLERQTATIAAALPERPLVLGGCCCAHLGAIVGLARRLERLAVVWLDAHGDLNTPESSPSGNLWGMPLRMAIERGAITPADVALVGARNLDPPELDYIERAGVRSGPDALERALAEADAVYVALDADVVEPGELAVFMPEPDGLELAEIEAVLRSVRARKAITGAGVTGLVAAAANEPPLARLARLMLAG
jgi:arginase